MATGTTGASAAAATSAAGASPAGEMQTAIGVATAHSTATPVTVAAAAALCDLQTYAPAVTAAVADVRAAAAAAVSAGTGGAAAAAVAEAQGAAATTPGQAAAAPLPAGERAGAAAAPAAAEAVLTNVSTSLSPYTAEVVEALCDLSVAATGTQVVGHAWVERETLVDENCHMLMGMKAPVVMNEQETDAWLVEMVGVYVQTATPTSDAACVRVQFSDKPVMVERRKVLCATLVWYAIQVLGWKVSSVGQDVATWVVVNDLDEYVQEAVDLINREVRDVEDFDARYYEYLFNGSFVGGRKDAGLYAKDADAAGGARARYLLHAKKNGYYTPKFLGFMDRDILPHLAPDSSGLSFYRSWFYNSGLGLAGWHGEDAGMHFGHQSVALQCTVGDALLAEVLKVHMRFSRKTWVMFKKGGAEGMQELNSMLGKLCSTDVCADELLVSRSVVWDPRVLAGKQDFEVVHQYPGQLFMSVYPHEVMGTNLFSYAWNYCFEDEVRYYLEVESRLAKTVRTSAQGDLVRMRNFVLGAHLVHATMFAKLPVLVKEGVLPIVREMYKEECGERVVAKVVRVLKLPANANLKDPMFQGQCVKCHGVIVDRVFMVGSGKKDVRCVWCVPKKGDVAEGSLMGLLTLGRAGI